jgi:hypothetical protein
MEPSNRSRCDICGTSLTADQVVAISGKNVCAKCKPDLMMDLKSGLRGSRHVDPKRAEEIRQRIKKYNILSFAFALPGLFLQFGGPVFLSAAGHGGHAALGVLVLLRLVGAPLIIIGLVFFSLMKGRSGLYGLVGLLSCLGLFILYLLPKSCQNCGASASYRAKECGECGAPV